MLFITVGRATAAQHKEVKSHQGATSGALNLRVLSQDPHPARFGRTAKVYILRASYDVVTAFHCDRMDSELLRCLIILYKDVASTSTNNKCIKLPPTLKVNAISQKRTNAAASTCIGWPFPLR